MLKSFRILSATSSILWFSSSCILSPPVEKGYLLSLQVPELLTRFDSVYIAILSASSTDTIEIVWRDSLPNTDTLKAFRPQKYRGEAARIEVEGYRNGMRRYRISGRYGGAGQTEEVIHFITASRDAGVDTSRTDATNHGYTGAFIFSASASPWTFCLAFDWSGIDRSRLTSATIRLKTYTYPRPWSDSAVPINISVFGLKSNWTEGTGNWYFHSNTYQNNGIQVLGNYPIAPAIRQLSTHPDDSPGLNPLDRAILRKESLDSILAATLMAVYTQTSAARVIRRQPAARTPASDTPEVTAAHDTTDDAAALQTRPAQ
jgi:hypothetical protein